MINKIKKISIEKLIFLNVMIIIIGIPLLMLYRYTLCSLGFIRIGRVNYVYLLWWSIPILFVLYIFNLILNKKRITFIDILVYLLIIFGVISTIYAESVEMSIYGTYNRNEGLLSLLSYYFILLNLKNISNEKYKNIIINTLCIVGVVQVIYSMLQVYTNLSFIRHYDKHYMALGLTTNPNFFGSFMVIVVSIAFSKYMLERKTKYLVLSIVYFMGLCFSSSTGPFLGFFLMAIFFTIFYWKKIRWKDLLKIIILFTLTYFFVVFSLKYAYQQIYHKEINPNYLEKEVTEFNPSNIGTGRVNLWKDSIPLVKKYWVFGAGIDNFGKVYSTVSKKNYDKVHNVYLQILITNGIFALTIYMIMMGIIFFKGLKIKEYIYISILMAFIGYCIQAFANISVIEVAPYFYIICGLLLGKIQSNKLQEI